MATAVNNADPSPTTVPSPTTSVLSPTGPSTLILEPPRDPGTFSGTDGIDVEAWLKSYERVGVRMRWDPTLMLANVIFYLRGTAKVWYETHEEELTSWELCKQKLRELFGRPVGSQRAAQNELARRVQTCTESYLTYIQDVLALCRKVDSQMSEADKVGHIIKGIADDAFHLLVFKNSSTVHDIISECRRFEEAKSRRVLHQFARLPNTAATSTCEDPRLPSTESPGDVVRIVRREIEAAAPLVSASPNSESYHATVSLIQTVVRQELANAGLNVCSIHRPDYATPNPPVTVPPNRRFSASPHYRDPAVWRTPDDRPICFNCGRIGHISRHCRAWSSSAPWPHPPPHRPPVWNSRSSPKTEPLTPENSSRPRSSRSPSPQRRFSRSPPSRRSPSPSSFRRSPPEN